MNDVRIYNTNIAFLDLLKRVKNRIGMKYHSFKTPSMFLRYTDTSMQELFYKGDYDKWEQ